LSQFFKILQKKVL